MAADDLLDLDVGAPAHGGACVARHDGRVVFVRHALPGERVRAVVTEESATFLRADAVEVLEPSPDRVDPPCPHAGPGRCGGCDWQHASGTAQRDLKAAVVREQFARLAHLEVDVAVEELAGGLLGWRSRIAFAADRGGRLGLRRHRSHEVEHVAACPLGMPGVGDSAVLVDEWPGTSGVEVALGDDGAAAVIEHRRDRSSPRGRQRPPDVARVVSGPEHLVRDVGERSLTVAATGFWQVHPAALPTLTDALLSAVRPAAGETVLELFAGAGALTVALADAVGPSGQVIGIEGDRQAVSDAAANLAELPWAAVSRGRVDAATVTGLDVRPDVVVLDPPRAGAGADVLRALAALEPRAIGYVSCDPATLARDVRAAVDAGYVLAGLRAFDAFPMTQHVECLALLTPAAPR